MIEHSYARRRRTHHAIGACSAALLLMQPSSAAAQADEHDWCRDRDAGRDQFCEVRHVTFAASSGPLTIDVGANGSIRVDGYDGTAVRVTARVVARARNESAARDLAEDVEIRAGNNAVRASGPRTSGRDSWTVSVRVQVPMNMAIDARTTNGSITVDATHGPVQARTTNGSITLSDVTGRVGARSTNGAIRATISRAAQPLQAADLRTTNGAIHITVPESISARLELSTTNGSINSELPLTLQGRINRRQVSAVLGDGGPEIRAGTTNGSIRLTGH